jgi:FKBP-type peptidyl-prolyl cis-trans isomerase
MKYLLTAFLGTFLLFSACVGNDQQTLTATDNVQASEPIPRAIQHDPYPIEDSLAIISLENGVKLYFVEKGEGIQPQLNDIVEVHYQGTLNDGKIFDSSFDRAQTVDLNMQTLIDGLRIALVEVPKGSKVKVMVPAPMAYGDSMPPNSIIPPNADLIFDVEVLDIK